MALRGLHGKGQRMIDPNDIDNLDTSITLYRNASTAWQRRIALDIYRATATPHLVGALLDEYVADAPTNAELDDIATALRTQAERLDAFGTNQPETAGIVAVLCVSGANIERNTDMAFILQDGQEVDLTVNYQDRHGNAAQVESQTWSSTDEEVVALVDNGDGSATATAVGIGTAQVQLVADARFGDDVNEIRGVLDIETVASEAVTATISAGEPVDAAGPAGGGGEPTDEPTPET
jgi:hypothetical protein